MGLSQPRVVNWEGNTGTCTCGREFHDTERAANHACDRTARDLLAETWARTVRPAMRRTVGALKPLRTLGAPDDRAEP